MTTTLPAQAPNARPLLAVDGLTVRTPHRALVHDFSLHMAHGERIGLIGESGSGKSMTTTALLGLLPAGVSATGSVELNTGREGAPTGNLLTAPESELTRIRGRDMAMVFQEPLTALNPLMRVGAQVAEIMLQHKLAPTRAEAHRRAVEMLDAVHLPDPAEAARAYPHQLSGGQRQRVMLAMALANDPGLLLCDEPTTALDVTVQRQVLDLILELVKQRNTGLLFITHDLAVVANMCTRVLVMNDGVVVEEGTTEEVFTRPQHAYTRGLLAASDLDATDAEGRLFTVASAKEYVPPTREQLAAEAAAAEAAAATEAEAAEVAAAEVAPAADAAADATGAGEAAQDPDRAPAAQDPAPATAESVMRVTDLVRTYTRSKTSLFKPAPEVRALKGISFEVPRGGRLGVVGESGSGKSTLLRILAGLDQPTSGSAIVAGNEVAGAKESQLRELRQQLQIVFQDPMGSLDPRMTVEQIIAEPLLVRGRNETAADRSRMVAEMLEAVGLPASAAERFPHQFSGGQRQRISIARALICRPQVVVADEPVSALDVSVRAQVLNLLADLVDEYGLTLVFVSHDLNVVRHLCDSVIVMQSGEIVEAGDTESVYRDPQHPYTQRLIASSLTLRQELAHAF
ncbi:dipeptide ABC transporter ATP-binding protein [Leucobacter luti]|uniref:Peptide/nickel transport system ATP-binding protein n=1 Tax=Leucobacter luti TaxID=340320 RepID=A0A4Q7TUM1_9MICO|nr:ABC transporter ATP-binding protein [Leucobacter luti]MBL3698274.1 ABC transporter ATP-binding protein [Leucobacter luti]RZT64641.1 peptide/nickel transport system ATP-binding protein [Leucobacter luti]